MVQTSNLPEAACVRWFEEVSLRDLPEVGGKNASLGELTRAASELGIRVPRGFAIPAAAFRWYLEESGLWDWVQTETKEGNLRDLESLRKTGQRVREAIRGTPLPDPLQEAIVGAYGKMRWGARQPAAVAVRSSATLEDLPEASFAGAQETFLHVRGEEALIEACHRCFESLYTDRALSYRVERGFTGTVTLSVGVQEMVDVSEGASGVMFTLDTETGCRDVILINAVPGLGEPLVQGEVVPDEYLVFRTMLHKASNPVLHRRFGSRDSRLVPVAEGVGGVRTQPVSPSQRESFVLNQSTILTLARWAEAIEGHYRRVAGRDLAMDIEWAWMGGDSEPEIVQARPETVHTQNAKHTPTRFVLKEQGRVLLRGVSIGSKIAAGRVRILKNPSEMHRFQRGEILVTERTDPDWEPIMRLAAGIVTERGGRTCHAAIVSRELGVPALVGARNATSGVEEGQEATLDCAVGENGVLLEGLLPFDEEPLPPVSDSPLRTLLHLNLADPGEAFRLRDLPCDGVGLVREEFLLAGEIGVHPLALLHEAELAPALREQIRSLRRGYADGAEFFVSKLAEGVAQIAAAFFPRPVLVRLSDLKTNEYAQLLGGAAYESREENPMLGFRGASRYLDPEFREAFALECRALERVRGEMGLKNVRVLVPFCRTPQEARGVLEAMERHGLCRQKEELQVWMMCEIPSNLVLVEEFAELFDGFSIGSNDLTQLLLGVDRDSEKLSSLFDERHLAVTRSIEEFVKRAHVAGKPVGLCGQAPSDYPDFARFLVRAGLDSISLNADCLLKMRRVVAEAEKES
ncbi:MAG: hypothetical protein RLZZ399_611 [Verrucomicrobiota bacterium]|jgi:pyruvate,water dikinase